MSVSSDSLSESSDVYEPTYLTYSTDRSCWEAFPLSSRSPEEIEQHLQACEALHYEQFKQLCDVASQCTTPTPEPVQSSVSPLESSDYMSVSSDPLYRSGDVSIYSWWSTDRSCWESFTRSSEELE